MAASNRPNRGSILCPVSVIKICCNSHEFELNKNHAIDNTNPMSPMRLYKIACSAAVFASARPYHHPIRRKDIIPTPSQPMNS